MTMMEAENIEGDDYRGAAGRAPVELLEEGWLGVIVGRLVGLVDGARRTGGAAAAAAGG